MKSKSRNTTRIAVIGIVIVMLILVLSTIWIGKSAEDGL